MKKRLLSILLVVAMLTQALPVFAAKDTSIEITDAQSFMSLNNDLSKSAKLKNDIELNIDSKFIETYKSPYIGAPGMPYTGTFDGQGHTITVNVDASVDKWGLFYALNGASISNLSIVLKNFHIESNASVTGLGILAYEIENSNINVDSIVHNVVSTTDRFKRTDNGIYDKVYMGTVAAVAKGTNSISFTDVSMYLDGSTSKSEIIAGGLVGSIQGGTMQITSSVSDNKTFSSYLAVSDDTNDYIAGGIVGEITGTTEIKSSVGSLLFFKPSEISSPTTTGYSRTLGGFAGTMDMDVSADLGGRPGVDMSVLPSQLLVGGIVGQNDGNLEFKGTTSLEMASYSDKNGEIVTSGLTQKSSGTLVAGSGVGYNNGTVSIKESALNVDIKELTASSTTAYLGGIIGRDNGITTKLVDNGVSFVMEKPSFKSGSSVGYLIGKTQRPTNTEASFNMVHITGNDGKKQDTSWVQGSMGDISASAVFREFRSNYLAYMGNAKIGRASQIFFTQPIKEFGDNPALENTASFPFQFKYSLQNSAYSNIVTIVDGVNGNVGTLKVTEEAAIAVLINVSIRDGFTTEKLTGHVYTQPDILKFGGDETGKKEVNYVFLQAVVVGGMGEGTPLPTKVTEKDSTVTFNYFNLPYEKVKLNRYFYDIEGHKYSNEILLAANRGIVNGMGEGTFLPDRNVTKAEFAAMLVRALGLLPTGDPSFRDVANTAWYYDSVNAAASWGIVDKSSGLFSPESNLKREDAMVMLVQAVQKVAMPNGFKFTGTANTSEFGVDEVSTTNRTYAQYNSQWNLMEVRDSGKFEPDKYLTRAEAAAAILHMLEEFGLVDRASR